MGHLRHYQYSTVQCSLFYQINLRYQLHIFLSRSSEPPPPPVPSYCNAPVRIVKRYMRRGASPIPHPPFHQLRSNLAAANWSFVPKGTFFGRGVACFSMLLFRWAIPLLCDSTSPLRFFALDQIWFLLSSVVIGVIAIPSLPYKTNWFSSPSASSVDLID